MTIVGNFESLNTLQDESFFKKFTSFSVVLKLFIIFGGVILWKLNKNIPKPTQNFANIFKVFKNKYFSKMVFVFFSENLSSQNQTKPPIKIKIENATKDPTKNPTRNPAENQKKRQPET